MKAPSHDAEDSTLATNDTTVGPRLRELEAIVERGKHVFLEVGRALLVIREERCFKERGFKTFEDYCQEHWGFSRSYAHRLIDAAEVVETLPIGNAPASESVARELTPLKAEPEKVREAWTETVEAHGPKPTAAQTRESVRRAIASIPVIPEGEVEPVLIPYVEPALEKKPKPEPDPAEDWFKAGDKAERERNSELYRVRDATAVCRRIDWDAFAAQAIGFSQLDRQMLENSAGILETAARQVRELLTTRLEVVK